MCLNGRPYVVLSVTLHDDVAINVNDVASNLIIQSYNFFYKFYENANIPTIQYNIVVAFPKHKMMIKLFAAEQIKIMIKWIRRILLACYQ